MNARREAGPSGVMSELFKSVQKKCVKKLAKVANDMLAKVGEAI